MVIKIIFKVTYIGIGFINISGLHFLEFFYGFLSQCFLDGFDKTNLSLPHIQQRCQGHAQGNPFAIAIDQVGLESDRCRHWTWIFGRAVAEAGAAAQNIVAPQPLGDIRRQPDQRRQGLIAEQCPSLDVEDDHSPR